MNSPDRLKAMESAVFGGDAKKVRLLLKAGVPPDGGVNDHVRFSFIAIAALHGKHEVFRVLADALTTPLNEYLLIAAVDGKNACSDIFDFLKTNLNPGLETVNRALASASANGHLAFANELLGMGADVETTCGQTGRFPLINAIENGFADVARLLIAEGASPKRRVPDNANETFADLTCVETASRLGVELH